MIVSLYDVDEHSVHRVGKLKPVAAVKNVLDRVTDFIQFEKGKKSSSNLIVNPFNFFLFTIRCIYSAAIWD